MTRSTLKTYSQLKTRSRLAIVAALSIAFAAPALAADAPYTNRLIDSADPYLLLHAHNPVDWYPWGPEAFAKAKAENKPIFLSIGYSTCYWCHVAETQIYSNPTIAALMNKWFVNVKVDREQRPDVDRLYIIATEMLTGNGAWPNNLFLTPDLKPFYAGSYFPPADQPGGATGFPTILSAIHDLWENHRADKIEPAATSLFDALRKVEAEQAASANAPVEPDAWMKQAIAAMLRRVDPYHGGFGAASSGPKFPQEPGLDLLLADKADPAAGAALTSALDAMAYGGIHDQLGGGFHRYATEPTWSVPHFEKMLADNAQLLALYAEAYSATRAPLFRDMADGIATYLQRDMGAPEGGFYTAQDAEIAGAEGADYLWTRAEIESALGAAAAKAFFAVYEITPLPATDAHGPTPEGGVLRIKLPITDTLKASDTTDVSAMLAALAPARDKLLALRAARPQPTRDDKIVTSLNGLAIDGFSRAAIALKTPNFVNSAKAAADRVWSLAYDPATHGLKHEIFQGKAEIDGYLEDYAMFGDGLLSLSEAVPGDTVWHARATTVADAMIATFLQPDGRLMPHGGDGLLVSLGEGEDSDVPAGASAALSLLTRLGAGPDGARFETAAASIAKHLAGQIAKRPETWPAAIAALVTHPIPPALLTAPPPLASAQVLASTKVDGVLVPAKGYAVPTTLEHVHASARIDGDAIVVTLTIDAGFHINAHKPSFDYLVPTDIAFTIPKPSAVAYPPSMRFKSTFAPDGLDVYEGDVSLVATFPKGVLSGVMAVNADVTAQACTKDTCLPPATLPVTAANPGR